MLAIFPVLMVARKIDFEAGDRLLYLRIAFVVVQACLLGLAFYVRKLVSARPEGRIITVKPQGMAAMAATEEAAAGERMTEREYDEREVSKLIQQVAMPVLMIGAIHYYWGTTVPLFIQLFMAPSRLYKNPLVKAYVLGETLPRPFPTPPGMFDQLKEQMDAANGTPQEDKKKSKKSKKKKN